MSGSSSTISTRWAMASRRPPGPRLPDLGDPSPGRVEPPPLELGPHAHRGLVERLLGQVEGAPVDAEPHPRVEIDEGLDRLLRRGVDRLHDLGRGVGPDGERGHVEGAEAPPRLLEAVEVAGVASEVEPPLAARDDPRRPQAPAPVPERALREVLRRHTDEAHPAMLALLPPVELLHVRHAVVPEPGLEPERHQEEWVVRRGEPPDGGQVEVVEVVVGDHHHVDARQALERQPGRAQTARPDPRGGAGPVAPLGIGEDGEPVHLHQQRGVPDPGQRGRRRDRAERGPIVGHPGGVEGAGRGDGLPAPPQDERPAGPARRPAKPGVEVPEAAARGMMGGPPGHALRAPAHAGDQNQQGDQRGGSQEHSARSLPRSRRKRKG